MWNSFPNVQELNQNFYYNDGKRDMVVKIPTGSYEISNIQDYLRDYMKKEHQKNPLTGDEQSLLGNDALILFGNRQTLKSEMICRYAVDFSRPKNIAEILSFDKKIVPPFTRVESDLPVNILSAEVIRVTCNLSESSYVNQIPSHVLHEFFPEIAPGYKIVKVSRILIYHYLNSRVISGIEIQITDQNNNLLDLRKETVLTRFYIRPNAYDHF